MSAAIAFQLPVAWAGLAPVCALIIWAAARQRQRGCSLRRVLLLSGLRFLPLLGLVFLAARPVRLATLTSKSAARPVMILVDRSESMSLKEGGLTRYQKAVDFLDRRLMPALKSANLPVQGVLFDQSAQPAQGAEIHSATPEGKRTNLGGAIVQAVSTAGQPPLAVIALSDGIANESLDNMRAMSALIDSAVPFIGVGFGSDQGVQTLALRKLDAPAAVSPHTAFGLTAELQWMNAEDPAEFDLVLFRDGQAVQRKSVLPVRGSRTWLENFQMSGESEGVHQYTVQLLVPNVANLKSLGTSAGATVKVSDEKELRVLYVEGALTWDYKFIGLALRGDSALKLTGLTRTSKQSVFRQNVESTGELLHGFPASLEELAPFRVVVLSNLRPADLSPTQQELLARFCGELGGGVLMIGGPATFDSSWQNSRLEQLLPVVFSPNAASSSSEPPFQAELTDSAVQCPVFQVAEERPIRETWAQLPSFTQYGKVDAAKLGAQVWMVHPRDKGPRGRRILMASQRYGAGSSAVLCIQNFWRWRLARECDPQRFDRFWRQMFRWLGDSGHPPVSVQLAEQELRPQSDVEVLLERQASPQNVLETNRQFLVQVEDGRHSMVRQEAVELQAAEPVSFRFRVEKPDRYSLKVLDSSRQVVAERPIEIRDTDVELEQTARNMETLQQWAGITEGLAFKIEECPKASDLVAQIKAKVEQVRHARQSVRPAGLNGWVMGLILGCLSVEWILRKRWDLA